MKRIDSFCAVWAGLVAGVLATLVQIALWVAFTDRWPEILWRDARLAAAIVLGRSVLPPPESFDWAAVIVATLVHLLLSVAYGFGAAVVAARSIFGQLASGAAFGLTLFAVNMYGFTVIFPWFAAARDPITVVAHIAFGVIAVVAYRRCAG